MRTVGTAPLLPATMTTRVLTRGWRLPEKAVPCAVEEGCEEQVETIGTQTPETLPPWTVVDGPAV